MPYLFTRNVGGRIAVEGTVEDVGATGPSLSLLEALSAGESRVIGASSGIPLAVRCCTLRAERRPTGDWRGREVAEGAVGNSERAEDAAGGRGVVAVVESDM